MKLSRHAFTTFWDVHAWAGVVLALVLHVMFFMGVFALFHEDMGNWQEGGGHASVAGAPPAALEPLLAPLWARGDVQTHQIGVYELDKPGPLHVLYRATAAGPQWKEVHLDRVTGEVSEPRSQLGHFLYGLHFLWHDAVPWLYYLAGFLSVGLLLAVVTGVVLHLKDFTRQLDQLRPHAKPRVFWSDLHKVLGVYSLPFQILFAFTGVLLCLGPFMARPFVGPVFKNMAEIESLFGRQRFDAVKPGQSAPSLTFDEVLERATKLVPDGVVEGITLYHRGFETGVARVVYNRPGVFGARGNLYLSLVDGRVLSSSVPGTASETKTSAIARWLYGLHFARFGGDALRILYAFAALSVCFVLLSGNWIWLARRERRRASLANQLLARLTLVIGGGVVLATVAAFWANRLLPWTLPARADWEQRAFFAAWLAIGTVLLLRPATRRLWSQTLYAAALGFGAIPLLSLLRAHAHAFNVAQHGDWSVFGVDVALLFAGLVLALLARVVGGANAARGAASLAPQLSTASLPPSLKEELSHG